MAVDPYKAYQMCIAMGGTPKECGDKYNQAKSRQKNTSWNQQKPQPNKATYKG